MTLVINFSGGKDSCAMLAYLCFKYPHIKKHVVFADTGWEHPGTEQWCIDRVAEFGLKLNVVRNPNKTLLTMAENRGMFPGMKYRQCTSDLKRGPINTWIRQNVMDKVIVSCIGIRSEESSNRAKQPRLKRNKTETNSKRTLWEWQPIKDWKENYVFMYLGKFNIPLHPVYKYLRRFSCRVCIYMTDHDLNQVQENDPEAINIIDRIEQQIKFTMFQRGPIKSLITTKINTND